LRLVVWRIVKTKYSENMFSGEGAAKFGGRWNSQGTRVAYTSQSLSLAALELLVHLEAASVKNRFVCACAEIPEDILIESIDPSLVDRSQEELQAIGDRWISSQSSAVLSVPSAVISVENNYLLNPSHDDFHRIIFNQPQEFKLDSRLVKQQPSRIQQFVDEIKARLIV
jgi:RES domain-containing protein